MLLIIAISIVIVIMWSADSERESEKEMREIVKDMQQIAVLREGIEELTRLSESENFPQCEILSTDGKAFCIMREHAKYKLVLLPLIDEYLERVEQFDLKYEGSSVLEKLKVQ